MQPSCDSLVCKGNSYIAKLYS